MAMDILAFLVILFGSACIRALAGWFENAFADKKISSWEWAKLGETIVRIVLFGFLIWYGTPAGEIEAASLGVLLDIVLSKLNLSVIKKK